MRIDSVALGEPKALGEGEHLDRQADVDRQLEHEPLTVLTDVLPRTQNAEDRLDAPEGVLVATDHDCERSGLDLRHAS